MVRDFKIRDNRFTVSFHLDILTVIPSNRHALINNIWDRKHDLFDFFLEFRFLFLKFCKARGLVIHLFLYFLGILFFPLTHQGTDLL